MPPGSRKYRLEDADSILKASLVIPQNKVECGEATDVDDSAATKITLDAPCRRIRVVVNAFSTGAEAVWFAWGSDYTNNVGGRVLVTEQAPLDIVLDEPESEFWVRRTHEGTPGGSTNVAIMGVY